MRNSEKPFKKKISITIDEDLYAQLNSMALVEDRNLSNYINFILRRFITSGTDLSEPHQQCHFVASCSAIDNNITDQVRDDTNHSS